MLVRSVELDIPLPAHRLMPVTLVAPERHLTIVPVCGARTLADGLPPMGIACAQQDVAHVYPLPDDPEAALEDFVARAADHARSMADRLEAQERSVQRFLEINGPDEVPCDRLTASRLGCGRSARRRPAAAWSPSPCPSRSSCWPSACFWARFLTTENRERDAIFDAAAARGRGDERGVLAALHGCDAACAAKVHAFLPKVTGTGAVKIARLDSGTSYSLGTSTGTRAWSGCTASTAGPIVQCVTVRREGRSADRTLR